MSLSANVQKATQIFVVCSKLHKYIIIETKSVIVKGKICVGSVGL